VRKVLIIFIVVLKGVVGMPLRDKMPYKTFDPMMMLVRHDREWSDADSDKVLHNLYQGEASKARGDSGNIKDVTAGGAARVGSFGQAEAQREAAPHMHKGGPVKKSGVYRLKKGEHVLTASQVHALAKKL
jgi:hypothetical protein